MTPPPRAIRLETARLVLRPTEPADIDRAFAIRQNWNVARNLSSARFPPDRRHMAEWFTTHAAEWAAGTAYRFAILADGNMIGIIDISDIADGTGELGYWLDEVVWGQGFAAEAGAAVVRFAFTDGGLTTIIAGHAADNLASGRVLQKLGFGAAGERLVMSKSRGEEIVQRRYRLGRTDVA